MLTYARILGSPSHLPNMDPRRARDPRLARGDPRLQRSHSGTPGAPPPPPPPPQIQASTSQQGYPPQAPFAQPHAYPAYPTSTPPQHPNHDVSNNQLAQEAREASAVPPQQPQQPRVGYKPRPLFCVVCASNQVSIRSSPARFRSAHRLW